MSAQTFDDLVQEAKQEITEIRPKRAYRKLEEDSSVEIIDIRENQERQDAAVPNSTHLNRGIIERDIGQEVQDPSREIILYCGGGNRSALAAKNLQKMGYRNVYSLKGGFSAWKDQELPTD